MPIFAGGSDFAERMRETCGDASSCALLITYLSPTACAPATTSIIIVPGGPPDRSYCKPFYEQSLRSLFWWTLGLVSQKCRIVGWRTGPILYNLLTSAIGTPGRKAPGT